MEAAAARKEWRAVPDAPLRTNGAEDAAERVKMAQSEGRAIYQDESGGLDDFCSITIDGTGGLSEDILQQRLQSIVRQREELQQVEIDLRAQAIAHPQIIEVQRRFGEATKEHLVAAEKLKEQLHEREKYILELEMKLDDTHRELDALKIDHQTVWANQDLLREQTKEIASFRERDNSEAERAQHLKQIHDLQEHLREKESQYLALEEQHRVAQDNILYKDEQLRDAHAWITRVQEMDILQSQSLQAELRERTDQFGQCWATFQQQYVEMQQGFLHTIQRLQLELIELRDRTGEQEDVSQAAQEGSAEASYVQSKGSNMAANGSALADGNQSTNDSFKMAGMHSYMLHPQGIPQSLASPNSGVPQFGTFQPTIQPTMHWPNQQEAQAASQTPDATNYHPSQSDQNALQPAALQPAASNNVELPSGQSQVTHPENLTAHGEQEQRSTSVVAESTQEPKVMESNVTEHFYNEEQKAHDSSSNASSTGKFERQEERSESKGEKVASGKQPVEHVPRKQNQASDSAGSTTQIHMNNMAPELKSNVVNQSDTLTSAGGGVGSLLPKEPVLLDERCLLACIVRAVPAGSDNRIRISSTLPNRLGKMLAPLHWHDYKKSYGKLDDFVASHNELFVIEGDFIHLREGAQQIISATTAAAKIAAAAAAASSASYSSLLPSVAVTPVAHTTRQKRGPVVDSRSSNSMPSGNGSNTAKFGNQHQANGFSDEVRAGQSSRHTAAANGGRHERVGPPTTHEKIPSARHGYGGKQQGRSAGTEFSSRR
ncbi:hypothetical protein CFC21_097708 [Triticum aestivum]|uniref:DUF7725 domain-containing protein n=3 Tax=Triticum TaxID=4564 RepID=A0A9R1LV76_WHEAT|nr:hypothetical protein CFC21_097708 [Triticum aestivum]